MILITSIVGVSKALDILFYHVPKSRIGSKNYSLSRAKENWSERQKRGAGVQITVSQNTKHRRALVAEWLEHMPHILNTPGLVPA